MPDGYEFAEPDQQPTPRYTSFARGFLGGFLGDIQNRQRRQRRQEDDARSNALKFLQTIPMSEHNAPVVTKMALEILASKPGKKHWTDQIFGTGNASNQYIDEVWSKLRGILPADEAESPEAFSERIPGIGDGTKTPVTIGDEIEGQGPSLQMGKWGAPPLTGITPVGTIYTPDVGAPTPAPTLPPRPAIDRSRISFANLPGKFKTLPGSYQEEGGGDFLMQVDERTGQTRKIPLGKITTREELVAKSQQEGKLSLARDAMSKGLMKGVLDAAANEGIPPELFWALPAEMQVRFYEKAGNMGMQERVGKLAQTFAQTALTQANIPVAQSKAKLYEQMAASGGLTPAQQQTDYRANLMATRKFVEEYDELFNRAVAAKQALDAHMNPPAGSAAELLKQSNVPSFLNKQRELQQAYTQAAGAAQSKAASAEQMFPGMVRRTGDRLEVTATGRPGTFQGGVNQSAIQQPEPPALQEFRKRMTQSPTGDLPQAPSATNPRTISGTAANPATKRRVGETIRDAGGNALVVTKVNPPSATQPYGSVEVSPAGQRR